MPIRWNDWLPPWLPMTVILGNAVLILTNRAALLMMDHGITFRSIVAMITVC